MKATNGHQTAYEITVLVNELRSQERDMRTQLDALTTRRKGLEDALKATPVAVPGEAPAAAAKAPAKRAGRPWGGASASGGGSESDILHGHLAAARGPLTVDDMRKFPGVNPKHISQQLYRLKMGKRAKPVGNGKWVAL